MPRKAKKKTSKAAKAKVTKQPKKLTLMDRLPKNEIEHVELLIKFTERAIPTSGGGTDKGMVAQAERLKARLAELKKAQN